MSLNLNKQVIDFESENQSSSYELSECGFIPDIDIHVAKNIEPTIEPTIEPDIEPDIEPTIEPTIEPDIEPTIEPDIELQDQQIINIYSMIDTSIQCVSEMMTFYKSMGYMYPDWLNLETNKLSDHINISESNIYKDIGYFMMTYQIDDKFQDIKEFRKSINKPFIRAIWHISSTILKSDNINNFSYELFFKLYNLIDVFCLLARPKTKIEFETSFISNYKRITSDVDNLMIPIPWWIYDTYSIVLPSDMMKLIHMYIYELEASSDIYSFLIHNYLTSLTLNEINRDQIFILLTKTFNCNDIMIGTLHIPLYTNTHIHTAADINKKHKINKFKRKKQYTDRKYNKYYFVPNNPESNFFKNTQGNTAADISTNWRE